MNNFVIIVPLSNIIFFEGIVDLFLDTQETPFPLHIYCIVQDIKPKEEKPTQINNFYLHVIPNTQKQAPYLARNLGVSLAKDHSYFVLLDANKLPTTSDWINLLLKEVKETNSDIIIVPSKANKSLSEYNLSQRFDCYNFQTPSKEDIENKKAFPLSMWAIKTEFFHKVGNFLEVRSLGDIEWVNRAYKHKPQIRISQQIQLEYVPKSGTQVFIKAVRMGFGKKQIYLLDRKWSALIVFGIKQLFPPNPFGLLKRMKARKYPFVKRDFAAFYLFTYASKFCYFWGLFKRNAPD